jgi:hypothetical protein
MCVNALLFTAGNLDIMARRIAGAAFPAPRALKTQLRDMFSHVFPASKSNSLMMRKIPVGLKGM